MSTPPTKVVEREPASFRDPTAHVVYADGRVLRTIDAEAAEEWRALSSTSFFAELTARRALVETRETDAGAFGGVESVALLEHERIPFVSYPYEWSFEMLRDAAALQLEVLLAALDDGFTLKDGSPYNVQWEGARPMFIDIGSFERYRPGEPWAGYRQFCSLFLYPLLLAAHKGIPTQPLLRGRLDGLTPAEVRRCFSLRDVFRAGVLANVIVHGRLERGERAKTDALRSELRRAGFDVRLVRANATRLLKTVRRLRPPAADSAWKDYDDVGRRTEELAAKEAFVRDAIAATSPRLVWDLGCNVGRFARLAAASGAYVVAMDSDPVVVDTLYRQLREEGSRAILPLTVDLTDPSPQLGWRGVERSSLESRGRPDLTFCLALLHHLAISRNVPIPELVDWLATIGEALVVEFVTADDPMGSALLSAKRPGTHDAYDVEAFERALADRFVVHRREQLPSETRILYFASPRR